MSIENQEIEDRIRNTEIRMAISFIAIVAIFFLCHSVWLVSSAMDAVFEWNAFSKYCHEENNLKTQAFCTAMLGPRYIILSHASRLLMVLNSSVNILLYGFVWNQFREEAKEVMQEIVIYCGIKKRASRRKSYLAETGGTSSTEIPLSSKRMSNC